MDHDGSPPSKDTTVFEAQKPMTTTMTKTSSAAPQRISPEDITENQLFRLGYAQKIIAARNADRVMAEYFISAYIRIAELKRELAEKDELISRLQAQLEAESK